MNVPSGPMTNQEKEFAKLLSDNGFYFGSDIMKYENELSPRQRWYIYYLVKRYRKKTGKKAGEAAAAWLKFFPTCPDKEKKSKKEKITSDPPSLTQRIQQLKLL